MPITTTLARAGVLSGDAQVAGWMAYINGGDYNAEQQALLVSALMDAQRDTFNAKLPENCHWFSSLSQVIGPVGTDLGDGFDLDEAMREAAETVTARFDEIEREVLGA